jgi:ABC-2 type transport system permease protein
VIFVLATGAIGLAFGSLVQHTAAAIVTYFVLGGAFSLLAIPAVQTAGQWINTGQSYGWLLSGAWPGHLAQLGTSTLAWVVLPLGLGIARTLRRDIS